MGLMLVRIANMYTDQKCALFAFAVVSKDALLL